MPWTRFTGKWADVVGRGSAPLQSRLCTAEKWRLWRFSDFPILSFEFCSCEFVGERFEAGAGGQSEGLGGDGGGQDSDSHAVHLEISADVHVQATQETQKS
jgi:hypothetical protein